MQTNEPETVYITSKFGLQIKAGHITEYAPGFYRVADLDPEHLAHPYFKGHCGKPPAEVAQPFQTAKPLPPTKLAHPRRSLEQSR